MEQKIFQTLNEILATYDIAGQRFDSQDYVAAIKSLPEQELQKDESQFESVAFMLQPRGTDENPFGGYYAPQFTFADQQGNPVYYPSLSTITPEAVLYWEQRYKASNNSLMKMQYAGLVWDFKLRIVNRSYDGDLCCTYVDSMLDVCNNDYAPHPVVTTRILERLFSISRNRTKSLDMAKIALRSFEHRHATDQSVRYWSCQFLLMLEHKDCFTQAEITGLVEQHEERMKRLMAPGSDGKVNVWALEAQCGLLADYYNRNQKKNDVIRVLKVSEEAHKKSFDSHNPLRELATLDEIQHKYRHYGLHEEANRLLTEIQSAGHRTTTSMTPQKYEFTIPQEIYDQADEMFGEKASSDEERWRNFAVYFIPRRDEEEKALAELAKKYPFKYMLGTHMLDGKGRPQSIIGSYEDDPEGNLVMHITEKLNFGTFFLGIAVKKMSDIGLLTVDRIMSDIIEPCPLFEDNSYEVIQQALEFFVDNKPILCCHLLVPQIERAIRNLVEASGLSVIKPQKNAAKGFQLITLDDLLRKDAVEYAFTQDGALYLRLVLTDQRSLNIRNNLCHGILPPDTFHSGVAARLLHILVMIGAVRET